LINKKASTTSTAPALKRIDFHSLQELVYEEIRTVLMRGGFAPGQKVSSRKLAAMVGTSDMPVRAAMGRLLAEGGLVQNANGTFSVPHLSRKKFSEIMTMRALLEREATMQACGNIDRAGFNELKRCSAGLSKAIDEHAIYDYLDYNQRLKFAIYRYTPSQTLQSMIRLMWLQAGPFLHHLNQDLKQIGTANFHEEAIAALEVGKAEEAGLAISRDILGGMVFLQQHARFSPEPDSHAREGEYE
jgi:DNA-binding GntR family transcriptional regulator